MLERRVNAIDLDSHDYAEEDAIEYLCTDIYDSLDLQFGEASWSLSPMEIIKLIDPNNSPARHHLPAKRYSW